ncbi:MAG: tyrosine-type recombinase/integrase [Verrucomicrobiota bacterium]
MTSVLVPDKSHTSKVPTLIADAGATASRRFLEFFTATIRNRNTRSAYASAVARFCRWCECRGFSLELIEPITAAAYIEELGQTHAAPSVKQHLAALRVLFDWLVTGQILPHNPLASVRGPRHVVKRGKTPVLSTEDARKLLDSIPLTRRMPDGSQVPDLIGLRDRALIGVMVFSFARVSATVGMCGRDFYQNGKRWWFRFQEKGGKFHEVPAHHTAEAYLDAYTSIAGSNPDSALFRSASRQANVLTERAMSRGDTLRMIKRRARCAGISPTTCCHTFRATGITAFLSNGGTIENAQAIAAHESPRTTKLYDRTSDEITLDEVERIRI